jgi:hypothetical protein
MIQVTTYKRLTPLTFLLTSGLIAQGPSQRPPTLSDAETQSAAAVDSAEPAPDWEVPIRDLNNDLPSWLQFNAFFRDRFERAGGLKYGPKADAYNLTQLRIMMIIHPAKWLRLVGETQDARDYFNDGLVATAPPYQNRWDIRQAYAQFGDPTDGWFDVSAGRRMQSYGEERLIGPSDWLNQGRAFDVVRLDLHHPGFNVSTFASSVVIARDGVIDHHLEGDNLYGIYSAFDRLVPKSHIEPFVFWHVTPGNVKLVENAGRGALNEVTAGARWAGKLPGQFDFDVEMAKQVGSLGPDSISSWAGHWLVGRKFEAKGKPRPFLESNYASGTKNPSSTNWGTFDQLYPSAHDKLDFADQVGWRNIEQVRTGAEESLGRKWKLKQTYESFWLASEKDALYTASGAPVVQSLSGTAGKHVGQELDFVAVYTFNSALETGFGYANLYPGRFLDTLTPGKDYTYPWFYLTYRLAGKDEH